MKRVSGKTKIHYLAHPWPEEWILSVAARTYLATGMASARKFIHAFCGANRISLGLAIVKIRHPGWNDQHDTTLLRFVTSFTMPECKLRSVQEALESENYLHVGYLLGRVGSRRLGVGHLRYCVKCALEQRQNVGEAYWCRFPQVRGLEYCHVHGTRLVDSGWSRRYLTDLVRLEDVLRTSGHGAPSDGKYAEALHSVSMSAGQLLDFEPSWSPELLRRAWWEILDSSGLKRNSGGASRTLSLGLLERFGSNYLTSAGCGLDSRIRDSWINRFLRNPAGEQDPLRHLLVLCWAGRKLSDLVQVPISIGIGHRIEESTFTCRNCVCPSLGVPCKGSTEIFRYAGSRQMKVHYTCLVCGQTNARKLENNTNSSMDWIVHRGGLWKDTLCRIWVNPKISLREAARTLGADPLTVKRHSVGLGLQFPRVAGRVSNKPTQTPTACRNMPKEIKTRRMAWLTAIRVYRFTGKARQQEPAAYAWLRRNDTEWLAQHVPVTLARTKQGRPSVDWAERERQFLQEIPMAYSRIMNRRPFQQCSSWAIAREIGAERSIKKLGQMPELGAQLRALAEDQQQFAIRRLRTRSAEMEGDFTFSQLRKQAGVRSSIAKTPAVHEQIVRLLRQQFTT